MNNSTPVCEYWNDNRSGKTYLVILRNDPVSLVQLIINLAGVLGNGLVIALLRKHALGGRLPTIFFRSQATLDLVVNTESIMFGIRSELWSVRTEWLNRLICRLWHSQFLFWYSVQLSIGNMVLIGTERFLALSFPILYQRLRPTEIALYCMIGNAVYNVFLAIPNILETGVEAGCCVSQHDMYPMSILLSAYSIVWFVMIYVFALVLLIFIYGGIVIALRQSATISRAIQPSVAMMRFTRMAIVITVVYVTFVSYDAFAYLTGRIGLWNYHYNTIWHKLGMLSVSLNSFANPYIYYLFVLHDSWKRKFKTKSFKMRIVSNQWQDSQNSQQSNHIRSKQSGLVNGQ
ncbi:uncharacterized protein DEA37_0003910 [Paragonimus westermani]|uniref:G-protein coupled receptors family 1 profile domain-containing protein n=1 Tax=Paragonimus westermani TaxID=34504 RepID=A0A5J4NQU0_9TREM|nr:uncharacterized protein DEA37_0003910 [Paragonimus westermani]